MIRKIVTALVLTALALVLISFAVANRQIVTVSFDPFDQANPALVVSQPFYLLIFALLLVGVLLGGCAAWLGQGKWRARARRAEAQLAQLRAHASVQPGAGLAQNSPLRLIVPPPAA
ncbi:MAG TPA: lipopolysaccharide assembly protein LapA domain-containing protein [Xanthobacteraceae bacterium]|jgi:uncharacterized integral membrane protein